MISQRIFARTAERFAAQRSITTRNVARRTYATEPNASGFKGAQDNPFNRERAAVKAHAAQTSDLWRKLSIYVVIPAITLASANAYRLWVEHWEHKKHDIPMSEKPQYAFMNIRNKPYPWGDGDKTLFWNDNVNWKPPRG